MSGMGQRSPYMEAWRGHFMTPRKGSLDFVGDSKMLGMPKPWDVCGAELHGGSGTRPREGRELQSAELEGVGDLKSPLTPDRELQDLEFVLRWLSISSLCSPSSPLEWRCISHSVLLYGESV